ncbi:MAG: SDR family oxidoreductase [Planctomycetota bacterium]
MTKTDRPVALITGSATGVGRACVLRFAKNGYRVVVNYSRSADDAHRTLAEVREHDPDARLIQCDVSDETSVREMIATIDQQFGRLDVLVNNAATTNFIAHEDLESLTEPMWDRMLAVNLKGPFFVTRAAASLLKAGAGGSVVNVSSIAGKLGSGSSIAYCASKAGLNTMTISLARVLAPKVRVNAVCPGLIDSRWIRKSNSNWDLDAMVSEYPIPRASSPDDIADAVWFLATGTGMTTGQLLNVDGGQTIA